jgi:RNA-directed DNA polymerase
VLLDEVDKELERRGHRFVRYADDATSTCSTPRGRAGDALLRGSSYGKLKLRINESKSAVDQRAAAKSWATRSGWPGEGRSNAG